jgi:hypothetical protein
METSTIYGGTANTSVLQLYFADQWDFANEREAET